MTQSTSPTSKRSPKKKILAILIGIPILLGAGSSAYFYLLPEQIAALASFPVQQGEFVISLTLKGGELEAVKAENITAPQVRGELQITHLFPEGEQVDIGDLLAEFDKVEFEKRVTETEQALEAAQADLEKTMANQDASNAQLQGEILNQEAQMRLAELQVEKMKFESSVQKEEAKLRARQAELRHKQAEKKYAAQKVVDAANTKKRNLQIARKKRDLEKAHSDLAKLSVKATNPGLVVYGKKWSASGPVKIRVGDEIWGGHTLITLPDLSRMQVKTYVNEVEVDKLEVGQKVLIKLDALPAPTFHGAITTIANLGREKEGKKNVKVFDVTVGIEEEDSRLKPGMTATSEVIIETIPPQLDTAPDSIQPEASGEISNSDSAPLYIPLDAVFQEKGNTLVFRLVEGQPVEQAVVLGPQNDNYVIIEEGLNPDDRVTLRNPTLLLDELGGIPQQETQKPKTAATE